MATPTPKDENQFEGGDDDKIEEDKILADVKAALEDSKEVTDTYNMLKK